MSKIDIEIRPQMKDHWNFDLDANKYHSDKSALNSSSLKHILKSPATFKSRWLEEVTYDSDALRFGSIVHQVILEGEHFLDSYVVMPEFNGSGSRAAKNEWLLEQKETGKTIVKPDELAQVRGMIKSVLAHNQAKAILEACEVEISGYFIDPETGIKCRIRPDLINRQAGILADLKTVRDCTERKFSAAIWEYRYDLQLAMYELGCAVINKSPIQHRAFICVEKVPPFETAVYTPEKELLEKGRDDYREAMHMLRDCLENNTWPGYQTLAQNINLPRYAL